MIPGTVHRSPGIFLTAEENPGKSQLAERLMKGCATSHRFNLGPFTPNEDGRIAQERRRRTGPLALYISAQTISYVSRC